jgi:competence protein ComEC
LAATAFTFATEIIVAMKAWNAVPLLRLLIPFIAGILAAVWMPALSPIFVFVLFVLFAVILLFTFTSRWSSSYRISWWYGLLINGAVFLLAYQLTISKTDQLSERHFSKCFMDSSLVYVRIASTCVEKEKSVKVIVECLETKKKQMVTPVFGKALVYFQKDVRSLALNSGDELILKATFREIGNAQNPGAFDYRRFMAYKNIYGQAYIKAGDWVYTGINSESILVRYSIRLRNKLLGIFKAAHLKEDEFAVAAALLVGYTDKLDEELLSAYSQTGTLHVLSVSGMHLAIVFLVFNRFLFFLDKFKYGSLLKAVALIFFLWFYALLTGLSPSVLRSATMFSFIVCARSFRRNSNIYNTLAASALFLLLLNPYLIMDVGFQLSYLAVAGIVLIQPFFTGWIKTNRWLLNQLFTLVTVSIAAQLATLPVSLYYFHQFPNYFLLSNLVVIPLSTCIIYMGMALIAISENAFLLHCASLVFSKTVALLNAAVVYIRDLPFAVTDAVSFGVPEVYVMYAFIIFLFLYFRKRKYVYLKMSLCMLIAGLGLQVMERLKELHQKEFIVYAIPRMRVVDFVCGREHVLLADASYSEKIAGSYMKPNWCNLGLHAPVMATTHMRTATVFIEDEAIQFYTKRIILLKDSRKIKELRQQGKSMTVDYVIVSENMNIGMEEVKAVYKPGCIVFDASNSFYRLEKWKNECRLLQQPCYAVADSGAYIADLQDYYTQSR